MEKKVFNPGVIGLTNYRTQLNRPLYSVVPSGARAGSPNTVRMRRARNGNYQVVHYPEVYPGFRAGVGSYTATRTMLKKRKKQYKTPCCLYIKGKRVCKPKFCPKKKYYRRKNYW